MNAAEILPLVEAAFQKVFECDRILFDLGDQGISEQSITFRLGYYLQQRFLSLDVDCEYNRLGNGLKADEQVDQEWMKPDVIVHARKLKENNLIVIEAKKAARWTGGWVEVEQKLKAFTRKPGNYEYRLGMAWKIAPSQDPGDHNAVWFWGGNEIRRTPVLGFVAEVSDAIKAKAGGANHED